MDVECKDDEFYMVAQGAFPPGGAYEMKKLPTLQWKIYGIDPQKRQVSGFYLFKSREAAEKRAEEAIIQLQQRPGIINVTSQLWEIVEEPTRICKGPIDLPMIQDLPLEE